MVGLFIRNYLSKNGRAYIYEVYREYKRQVLGRKASYNSFRKYFHYLVKLNLIRFVDEEDSKYPWLEKRRYFELVPENANIIEAWARPQVILYPATIYGKSRYEEKKKEATLKGLTVEQLAVREYPEINRIRGRLGLPPIP